MTKINKSFTDKLCSLLSFLNYTRKEFELVTEEMDEDPVRMAIRGVAVEANQYELELKTHLQNLSIPRNLFSNNIINCDELLNNIRGIINAESLNDILDICAKSERFFETAYRNILNEYFPYPSLHEMLVYQLNGIKYTFMKIKLLSFYQ